MNILNSRIQFEIDNKIIIFTLKHSKSRLRQTSYVKS